MRCCSLFVRFTPRYSKSSFVHAERGFRSSTIAVFQMVQASTHMPLKARATGNESVDMLRTQSKLRENGLRSGTRASSVRRDSGVRACCSYLDKRDRIKLNVSMWFESMPSYLVISSFERNFRTLLDAPFREKALVLTVASTFETTS